MKQNRWLNILHVIVNANSITQHLNPIKNRIMINANASVKKSQYQFKKDYSWNPSICTCENKKHLKCIADYAVVVCDDIVNVTDSASMNVTNTLSKNVTHITSTNVYIILIVIFCIVLISDHIIICNCCYLISLYKTQFKIKMYWCTNNM